MNINSGTPPAPLSPQNPALVSLLPSNHEKVIDARQPTQLTTQPLRPDSRRWKIIEYVIPAAVSKLWRRLIKVTSRLPCRVEPNESGIQCLETPVTVTIIDKKDKLTFPIHANRIEIFPPDSLRSTQLDGQKRNYVAGQSPQIRPAPGHAAGLDPVIDAFLTQGIESKTGLYQFVSERAHRRSTATKEEIAKEGNVRASRETPIISELEKAWKNASNAAPATAPELVIGGRYRITRLERSSAPLGSNSDNIVLNVTVSEIKPNGENGASFDIPLTQVGLSFKNRLLKSEQIERADELMNQHVDHLTSFHAGGSGASTSADTRPATAIPVISFAGIGRNATLIAYRETCSLIREGLVKTEGDINIALEHVINKGREQRGPHFIHSANQLNELVESLKKFLNNFNGEKSVADVPMAALSPEPMRIPASPKLSPQEAEVTHFFQGDGPSQANNDALTLKKVLNYTPDQLKNVDNFIQRLFPIDEISNNNFGAPVLTGKEFLSLRQNPLILNGLDAAFKKILGSYGLQWEGKKIIEIPNSDAAQEKWRTPGVDHDGLLTRIIRSMSLFGKSDEAVGLFNFLKNKNTMPGDSVRLGHLEKALTTPVVLSNDSDPHHVLLFPTKRLIGEIPPRHVGKVLPENKVVDPIKSTLFKTQSDFYGEARLANSEPEMPLKAFFTKPATIAEYDKLQHLKNPMGKPAECNSIALPNYYFSESSADPAHASPDPGTYNVYVDFANQHFGGGWNKKNCFAQEEIAFIENSGLATVAKYGTAIDPLFQDTVSNKISDIETAFLTRRSNTTPSPILIEGCERVGHFTVYDRVARGLAENVKDAFVKTNAQPTNWLAIAAPDLRPTTIFGPGVRNDTQDRKKDENNKVEEMSRSATTFLDIFSTAHAGFSMAKKNAQDREVVIHTGKLGCGIFKNNITIATAAQLLAAKVIGINGIKFYDFKKDEEKNKFNRIDTIISRHMENANSDTSVENLVRAVWQDEAFKNEIISA